MARNYMQHQGWHLRAGSSLDYRQSTDAQSNYSFSSGVSSQNHLWGTNSSSEITDWNQVLSTEPVIATDSTYHDLRNDDLKYPHIAARDIADNNPDSFRGYESMPPSGLCEVVHRKSVNGSELELNSSLSATTHPEQTLKSDSYSPGPMPDPASLSGDWNSSSTFPTPIGGISPYSVSSSLYLDTLSPLLSKSTLGTYASDHSESLGMKALFIPNTRTTHNGNDLPVAHLQARCAGYGPSNSRGPQLKVVRNDEPASVSSSHNNGSVQGSWAKSHTSIHFHPSFNETLQIPRTVDAQAQRKQNDDLLIQGKKEGLTYKEIRKRMVGQKPAESTLRGRYRSLTKQRKDRVRKPIISATRPARGNGWTSTSAFDCPLMASCQYAPHFSCHDQESHRPER
ncbi:hypothetical protein BKA66DRAFT_449429 [Pyrenochaeta sp. MPI-SDFR-AT-0127]|nr:hypothetical protein BKA66DRAFT_449429 [Pyrenochaeta sp. MPI-SDFR-AT-0127]